MGFFEIVTFLNSHSKLKRKPLCPSFLCVRCSWERRGQTLAAFTASSEPARCSRDQPGSPGRPRAPAQRVAGAAQRSIRDTSEIGALIDDVRRVTNPPW